MSYLYAKTFRQRVLELLHIKTRVSRQMKNLKSALKQTKKKERRVTTDLQKTEQKLEQTKQKLNKVSDRLQMTKQELNQVTLKFHKVKNKLDEHNQLLDHRLVEIYKNGNEQYIEVLLNARDFSDFASRGYLLREVVSNDIELLNKIQKEKEKVAVQRVQIAEKHKQINLLHQEVSNTKRSIEFEANRKHQILRSVQEEKAAYERALEELEQNSRQIERMLRRLLTTPRGRTRLSHPWRGTFLRPVNGAVTSDFGYRTHPIFKITKFHTGVDISAPMGSPIFASADGEVVFSGWWGGYGKVVIIDHGGGIATLYGHCSSISVATGQKVKKGQFIAKVGSTGLSTGPHCHFEVRKSGSPINPSIR